MKHVQTVNNIFLFLHIHAEFPLQNHFVHISICRSKKLTYTLLTFKPKTHFCEFFENNEIINFLSESLIIGYSLRENTH